MSGRPERALWDIGDFVAKKRGSQWRGVVVGFYSNDQTPIGYSVKSLHERDSVQVWPEGGLVAWDGVTDVEHARNQALEEAAQEAEKWFPADSATKYPTGGIAAAIRAMKSKRVEVMK